MLKLSNTWNKLIAGVLGLVLSIGSIGAGAQNIGTEFSYISSTDTAPSFSAALQTSLVPQRAYGSSTATYTRASTAYQTDFEGKFNVALSGEARMQGARRVQNRLSDSYSLTVAAGWAFSGTITTGAADPNGGTTAVTLAATGVTQAWRKTWTTVSGNVYNNSVWIKRISGTGTLYLIDPNNAAYTDITSQVTTSWQRFTRTPVTATGTTGTLGVRIDVSGDSISVWHPLTEDVTGQANQISGDYVSINELSAPYQGAGVDGVQYFNVTNPNSVASNIVTIGTGLPIKTGTAGVAATAPVDANGPLGQIDEPSQANLVGTTAAKVRTMTDAAWVNGGTMTVAAATGVDGVASAAAKLTGGAVAATNTLLLTPGLGAAVRTYVVWMKRVTGTGTISITGDGSTWVDITAQLNTSTYVPVSVDAGSVVPIVGVKITTNTDAVNADFNVLVAGAIAPALPIPVNVTTAADVLQYVSASNLASTNSGTMSLTPATALGSAIVFHFATYVDANNYTAVLSDGTNLIARKRITGTNHDATIAWTRTVGTAVKVGWRFDTVNGSDIWLSGTKGTNDATTTAAQIGTNFQLGADGNGANQDYCEHRFVQIWPVALPSFKLQWKTTDAIDWLSSEWWRVDYAANDETYRIAINS